MGCIPRISGRVAGRFAVAIACLTGGVAHADESGRFSNGLSLAAVHSDIKFQVFAPARAVDRAQDGFALQVKRVARGLETAALRLFPDAMSRIGAFDVYVADASEIAAQSSAVGRIALNAGFASLNPTDDWIALVVAREMAHVVAGHHDNNSTASIITSVVMNLVLPGSGLVKSALSFAGSQVASNSGRERQLGEADAMALRLLEGAGYSMRAVALNITLGPKAAQLGDGAWARAFLASGEALVVATRGPQGTPESPSAVVEVAAPVPVASTAGHLATRPAPEDIVVRTRPSGMPGPLLLGGHWVPARRVE
jgi:hypothetical protein